MTGVGSLTREFSDDFKTMRNEYKYVVKYFEDGVYIKYLEKDSKTNQFIVAEEINIVPSVAELLFRAIVKDFDNGDAKIDC